MTLAVEECRAVKMRDLMIGEFFKRKPGARKVYQREHYDRTTRTIGAGDVDDISREIYLRPDTIVYVGFTY